MPQVAIPLSTIEYSQLRPGGDISLRQSGFYNFSERGFSCPAYRWDVSRQVDLTPIRFKWRSSYALLKVYSVERQPEETPEEVRTRLHILENKLDERSERMKDPRYDENFN